MHQNVVVYCARVPVTCVFVHVCAGTASNYHAYAACTKTWQHMPLVRQMLCTAQYVTAE